MPRLPGGAAQCLLAVTRLSSQNITDSAQPPLTEAEPSGMPQYPSRPASGAGGVDKYQNVSLLFYTAGAFRGYCGEGLQ